MAITDQTQPGRILVDPTRQPVPPGIDPRIAAVYTQFGATPGAAGSGLYDESYWNTVGNDPAYAAGRLTSDFQGTGPDVGTPGYGAYAAPGTVVPSGGGGGGGFNPITPTSQWSPDPRTNDLYHMLNTEATQNPIPSPNDPVIKAQTNAYNAQATRDMRNYMNELAEKGGPNANLGAQGMQAAEQVAQGAGQFQGTLMQNELNARRQQIQEALTGMGNLLSDQQRMQLQNQLAIMDNLLGQASLEQNAYAFDTTNANNTSPLEL